MTEILPPINGVTTFSCQSATHHKCTGSRWNFTLHASVACACECHAAVPSPTGGTD